jgi:hypothetical protein
LDAALARDADPVIDVLTNTSTRRRVTSKPSPSPKVPNCPRSTRLPPDDFPPRDALPSR